MTVFFLGVGAACLLGLGFVLQQHAAQRAPKADLLSFRLLLDLMRQREWLFGLTFMVVGQLLSAAALSAGRLSLVEPLLTTNLVFAMLLARWTSGEKLGRSGWGGVLLLAAGVSTFILAGQPTGGGRPAGELQHWLVVGIVAGLALLLVSGARRMPLVREATLLATAAGLLYGLQDGLTRTTGLRFDAGGLGSVLTSWQTYAIVAIGIIGLVLVQSAFESAPLKMSLPALTAAQPLAGIVCGVGFLGDRLNVNAGALAWESVGLVCIVVGVVVIGRHPALPDTCIEETVRAAQEEAAVHGSTALRH
ncbi:DMT family transporter [Streptacidiphilus monticola]|uniref:DMT family transporter n=1 Tax=Streptacidiphilus monticola TaxID=2161674 RepID=A0ABW1G608_9ACTN